jgi:hypothetical protein
MDLDQNRDLGIVSNVILSFAQNGIISSDTLSTAATTPIVIVSKTGIFSDLSKSSLEKRNLNSFSEFSTPYGTELAFNKDYQSNDYVFNTQPMKRANETFTFFDDNKKAKSNDFNRINKLMNTVDLLMEKITRLESKVLQLEEDNTSLKNQNINVDINHVKENIIINNQIAAFDVKIRNLENLINKDIEMIDNNQQTVFDKRSFADLFKNNDNKTISEPVHDLINILSNNEDEKRKREYNIIVFGLNVKSTDTNFTTIMNLMNELGVNKNKIWDVCYLKKKDVINEYAPIKIVASSLEAKYFILKAARKLQAYNVKNKTKINISVDMSNIDRQINKKLVDKRNELNSQLKNDDKFYFGIRDNKVIKLNKRS